MRPFTTTVIATAGGPTYSPVYVVDHWTDPCNIAIGVDVVTTALYTVQHTFADPFTINLNVASAATWYPNEILVSANATNDTNYAFPPSAIRLKLYPANTGSAIMTIIQAGPG